MVEKILYYLNRENERNQIVENAYQLVTQQLTLGKSVKAILNIVENRINSEGPMKMISNDQVLTELAL